uniref:Odorant receptor n=1 Tax=Locusta migratoria TaxID=7004 RepID=A0A0M4JMK6_LOCMI|nr:odorant receptor 56 [Locusta migratoria]
MDQRATSQSEEEEWAGQSVVRTNTHLLRLLGLWRPARSRLYDAYTAAVLAVGVADLALASAGLWLRPGGLAEVTLGLANLFVILTALSKSVLLLGRRPLFYELVRRVDGATAAQRPFCGEDPLLARLSADARARADRLSRAMHWYVVFAALSWSAVPLLAPPGDRVWPFQQLPPRPWARSPLYEASYALQVAGTTYFALINMDSDCFFMAVMTHVSLQFRILASRFAKLNSTEESLADKKASDVRVTSSESTLPVDDTDRELRACIQTHQKLLRLVNFLNDVMSPMAMMQLALGVINSCMVLFPATYSEDSSDVMKCWGALPLLAIQVFLYCSGAQRLADQLVQATYSYYTLLQHFNSH